MISRIYRRIAQRRGVINVAIAICIMQVPTSGAGPQDEQPPVLCPGCRGSVNSASLEPPMVASSGVKIIQYHGWNDQTLQPAYSPQW